MKIKTMTRKLWVSAVSALFLALSVGSAKADLLAAWEFDAADVSGSSVSVTDGSAANTTGTLIADADASSGVLELDGSGDYLQFGDNVSDLRGLSAMTISAWVKCGNVGSTVFSRIVEHDDNFYFWQQNGKYNFTVHGGGTSVASTNLIAQDIWQHVLAVYQAGQPAKIYINGALEASSGNMNAMLNNTQRFSIGASRNNGPTPSSFFTGDLDDVAIWDEVLSTDDIALLAGKDAGGYDGRFTPTDLYAPVVSVGIPTALGKTNVTLNAKLSRDGGSSSEVWLYWGATDGGTDIAAWANTNSFGFVSVDSMISTNLMGLTAGTTYYYRYYGTNATGSAWSDLQSITTWDSLPDDISDLQLWLKADEGVYLDAGTTSATNGGVVTQWTDFSGNAYDASRYGVVANVTLVESLSTMPMVNFTDNTGDDYLQASGYTVADTDDLTVFVVAKAVQQTNGSALHPLVCSGEPGGGNGTFNIMMSRPSAGDNLGYSGHGYEAYPYQEYVADSEQPNFVDGKIHVITLTISNVSGGGYGTLTGHYDGILKEINNGDNLNPYNGPVDIGGSSLNTTRRFAGSLGDILIYDRVLSDNERNEVGWYLQEKYSVDGIYRDPKVLFMTNTAPSSVLQTSATFNGELFDGDLPADMIVYWGTEDGGTDAAAWANTNEFGSVSSLGSLSTNITGLTQGTRYYYRYYGSNSVGEVWSSSSVVFATQGAPVVDTVAVTAIDTDSAMLKGLLFSDGGASTSVRAYWGTSDGGTTAGSWTGGYIDLGTESEGPVSAQLGSLSANSTYFFRFYAENTHGGSWAADSVSFTTSEDYNINANNLVLWLRADAGVTESDGVVESWADQATLLGGANSATGSGSSCPQLVSNVIGTKPVVEFDGSDDFLTVPDSDALDLGTGAGKGWTVACVYHRTGGDTSGFDYQEIITKHITGSADTDYKLFMQDSDLIWGTGISTDSGAWMKATEPSQAPHVVMCTLEQTGSTNGFKVVTIDGTEATSGAYSKKAAANTAPVLIGGSSATLGNLDGQIAEIMVFNCELSEYRQQSIGWYLQEKYGISGAYTRPSGGTLILVQ